MCIIGFQSRISTTSRYHYASINTVHAELMRLLLIHVATHQSHSTTDQFTASNLQRLKKMCTFFLSKLKYKGCEASPPHVITVTNDSQREKWRGHSDWDLSGGRKVSEVPFVKAGHTVRTDSMS
ncbi:hypothetical protein BST61_g5212 [Cercospora zeina]